MLLARQTRVTATREEVEGKRDETPDRKKLTDYFVAAGQRCHSAALPSTTFRAQRLPSRNVIGPRAGSEFLGK